MAAEPKASSVDPPVLIGAGQTRAEAVESLKAEVRVFWERASCGEDLYLHGDGPEAFAAQADIRYQLEPYIVPFAGFEEAGGKDVLEIGVGLGADHQKFAEAGARLTGIDLTQAAIDHTARRFAQLGLTSHLQVGDAENLPFPDESFDIVYAWGVIHHSPDTAKAARELFRVLRPGGRFAVMIYHRYSFVGYMLWLRYALLTGKPFTSLDRIYARHLESPGTKAYSRKEGAMLFAGARDVTVSTILTHGDLLESEAGQRHRGPLLSTVRKVWPRPLIRTLFPQSGLFMMIGGFKPGAS